MLLAYLLLFLLLHLPSSACEATSRNQNHRLLLPTAADIPAPSPSTTLTMQGSSSSSSSFSHAYVRAASAMMQKQQGPALQLLVNRKLRGIVDVEAAMPAVTMTRQQWGSSSPPEQPEVNLRGDDVGAGDNGMPPSEQKENAAAMIMAPPPLRGDDTGYEEAGGEAGVGGEAGGGSSATTTSEVIVTDDDQPEGNADIGIDYAPPKTHPPSHN